MVSSVSCLIATMSDSAFNLVQIPIDSGVNCGDRDSRLEFSLDTSSECTVAYIAASQLRKSVSQTKYSTKHSWSSLTRRLMLAYLHVAFFVLYAGGYPC